MASKFVFSEMVTTSISADNYIKIIKINRMEIGSFLEKSK